MIRDPIDVDDVLGSRLVAYPLRLSWSAAWSPTAEGALVLTRPSGPGTSIKQKPVYVLGTGNI